jgi:hypothetical protein
MAEIQHLDHLQRPVVDLVEQLVADSVRVVMVAVFKLHVVKFLAEQLQMLDKVLVNMVQQQIGLLVKQPLDILHKMVVVQVAGIET